jgi:hypothetical protein
VGLLAKIKGIGKKSLRREGGANGGESSVHQWKTEHRTSNAEHPTSNERRSQ